MIPRERHRQRRLNGVATTPQVSGFTPVIYRKTEQPVREAVTPEVEKYAAIGKTMHDLFAPPVPEPAPIIVQPATVPDIDTNPLADVMREFLEQHATQQAVRYEAERAELIRYQQEARAETVELLRYISEQKPTVNNAGSDMTPIAAAIDRQTAMFERLLEATERNTDALLKPKKIVRDKSGRATGLSSE